MNAITPAEAAPVARELDRETIKEAIDKPFSLLPHDWRPVVWNFWAKFASLLRSQLDLAASLRDWIAEHGYTLDEARQAFAILTRPEGRAKIQYPGQVVAQLAELVAIQVAARKSREAQAKRRAADEEAENVRKAVNLSGFNPAGAP